MITRFDYHRSYKRRGILIECRWFVCRIYLPILPKINLFWR